MVDVPAPTSAKGYSNDKTTFWGAPGDEHEEVPDLRWPRSVDVYDRMRRQESQIRSVLRAVALPILRTDWWIEPNGARDEVVQHVSDDLNLPIKGAEPTPKRRTRDRFSWNEHLRLALLMLPFGHAYFEQEARFDGQLFHLAKLSLRPSRTIAAFNVAADGGLESIEQYGHLETSGPNKIDVSRLVAYVYEREGGNWAGASLLRPGYKNWLLKDRLLRIGTMTVERNGLGIPIYEAGEDEKDLTAGTKMAQDMRAGENAGGATPNGAKMRLVAPEGHLPDALPWVRYHDEQMARAVLAHFLNLGTQTGSWALGSTFADFFTLSLQALGQQVAETASMHVVEDLVDWNWGTDEPAPLIGFQEIGSQQQATAAAIKLLADAGIILPDKSLEEAVRQQMGLPSKDPRPGVPNE